MARVWSAGWRLAAALGVTLLAGALLAADGTRQAGHGGQVGLRVVHMFGPAGGTTDVFDIGALGDRDAAAVGYTCDAACNRAGGLSSRLLVERWDGVAWRALPGPAGLAGNPSGFSVSGASAGDFWVAALGQEGSGASAVELPYVLHWSHGHWGVFRFARGAELDQVVAFSDSDVWAFGAVYATDGPFTSYDLHYDGHAWRKFSLPVLPGRAGVSAAGDMWMVGLAVGRLPSRESDSLAVHWDGHAWQTIRMPVIKAPPGRYEFVDGIVVAGRDDIWTSYGSRGENGDQVEGLLHWVHGRWQRVRLPPYGKVTTPVAWMDQDGHGGLWLVTPGWLAHYSHGSWTRTGVLPLVRGHTIRLDSVTRIPRSVWAGAWIAAPDEPGGPTQFALLTVSVTGT